MRELWQDGKYGLRMMGKNPGFSLVAVLTLALGIGANTAIFSVINAVLLRPLPYAEPERLVAIGTMEKQDRRRLGAMSYPDFADWRAGQTAFERMAASYTRSVTMASKAGAVRMSGAVVTSELFPLLGVQPLLGRAFGEEADRAGGGRWALLSHATWQTRFDGDPGVIGRAIALNGQSYTVAGVMPPAFQYPIQREPIDLWTNMAPDAEAPAGAQIGRAHV